MGDKKMIVSIRNYQRIKKAQFVFEPGLNVIVGPSNNGKSSSLRAITTALFNLSKDSHVTVGETVSMVGIRYRGHDVVWKRDISSASKNSYKIDGKVYNKLGRGQPQEVADALGIFEVDLDDTKERLNFQKQMAYPFLLDRTPSQVFKFMAQSAEEDNLMAIIDQMKTDQNSIGSAIKANQAAMDSIKVALVREKTAFDSIKSKAKVCQAIIQLDSVVKKFTDLEGRLVRINSLEIAKKLAEGDLYEVQQKLPLINQVTEEAAPLVTLLVSLASSLNAVNGHRNVMLNSRLNREAYEKMLDAFDGMPSGDVFNELAQIWAIYSQGALAQKAQADSRDEVTVFRDWISNVQTKLSGLAEVISDAEEAQKELDALERMILQAGVHQDQMQTHSETITRYDSQLQNVVQELSGFDMCPYCGSDLRREEHGKH